MAADASLSLDRISGAMHAMFSMLSKPDTLPEFIALQVMMLSVILSSKLLLESVQMHCLQFACMILSILGYYRAQPLAPTCRRCLGSRTY